MADTIDDYIVEFPTSVQAILSTLRARIRKDAPEATERMAYGIPTFYLNGNLVHFAAFERHIGFYPTPGGIVAFAERLKRYQTSKGSVQFPIDEPLPFELISEIVAFRVRENVARSGATKSTTSGSKTGRGGGAKSGGSARPKASAKAKPALGKKAAKSTTKPRAAKRTSASRKPAAKARGRKGGT